MLNIKALNFDTCGSFPDKQNDQSHLIFPLSPHPPRPHRPQDRVPPARREDQEEDLQHPHQQDDALGRRQRGGVHHVQGRPLGRGHQGHLHGGWAHGSQVLYVCCIFSVSVCRNKWLSCCILYALFQRLIYPFLQGASYEGHGRRLQEVQGKRPLQKAGRNAGGTLPVKGLFIFFCLYAYI